ncbi:universal stress protein [Streptomyces sp. NBC_00091]|uniref:universal stress protein n=1 Tax=Streptomyces sp. NBC_00091 TaxID=2975648 RepID=UPI00224E10C3|nr:universal stress protein [Streptomyces sp. NBC_00091]MCX5380806.1 universal stress protein [Streptomyces sp. NBC_00091]
MGRRVVAGVSGGPGSLTALHRAADEARLRGAQLWAVLAWQAPGGGLGSRGSGAGSPYPECRAAAVGRLREALDAAFGPGGPGIALAGQVVRGTPGAVLVDAVRDAGDLLVVGAGCRGRLLGALRPSVARHCLAHAPCPVLAVPPSPLEAQLHAVRRRNAWHLPLDARELAE